MINYLTVLIFPILMAYAASSDLLTMRISNKIILALIVGFALVALLLGMPVAALGWHFAAAGLVLVFAFAFFAFGWIGGGDAKLAAATALWVGFTDTLPYLVYAALMGGALTLAILALRKWPLPLSLTRVEWISRLHNPNAGVPYGIALAASGLLIYSDTALFQQLLG